MAAPRSSAENSLQSFIHSLEQGRLVPFVRTIIVAVVLLAVSLAYLGWKFRGFATAEAMDQAQVARQLAHGRGWTTKFIRPLALWQIEKNTHAPATAANFPDTFNAPLPPLVNALPVRLGGDTSQFKRGELIAPAERFIAGLAMLFFLLAVGVQYLLLRRYFDARLAFWAALLTLLTNFCWEWTLTGLPQMFMLLLFHLALYSLARASEAQQAVYTAAEVDPETFRPAGFGTPTAAEPAPEAAPARKPSALAPYLWLTVAGVFFGLLALSHPLTIWMLAGVAIFCAFHFRQGALAVVVLLAVFAVMYAPWLLRTYHVSGNPTGVAGYALFDGLGPDTATRMRSTSGPQTSEIALYFFRPKIQTGISNQISELSQNLGGSLLALMFFVSLLHPFRRTEVSSLRWAVLLMWLLGVLGMAFLGNMPGTPAISANQLGVLFLPIMLSYGLAFVLVLFARLEISSQQLARIGLFTLLVGITALPMIFRLLPDKALPYQYPPYLEPVIALVNGWTTDREVVASDMPWGVAWYADRKSLWIPDKYRDMMTLSDNNRLSGPIAGLFISPISRGLPYNSDIYKGSMQEYAPLVLGSTNVPYFPFHEVAAPMGDLSYIFYSDTKRWEKGKAGE